MKKLFPCDARGPVFFAHKQQHQALIARPKIFRALKRQVSTMGQQVLVALLIYRFLPFSSLHFFLSFSASFLVSLARLVIILSLDQHLCSFFYNFCHACNFRNFLKLHGEARCLPLHMVPLRANGISLSPTAS